MDDIRRFLREDVGRGDVTSESLFAGERARGTIFARQPCIVAGLEEAGKVFKALDLGPKLLARDGREVRAGTPVLVVEGRAVSILKGERLALNFLMRMSGIATETRRLVEMCRKRGAKVLVAGTRKTVPGFRRYDKKAIELGGGWPHRMGLYDGILIKDNHLALLPITEAIRRAKHSRKPIEVEAGNERDALEAAEAGADIVMLDNMSPAKAKRVSSILRHRHPKVKIEISGGVTPENILLYARSADLISLGYLTHSVRAANFSMDVEPTRRKRSR